MKNIHARDLNVNNYFNSNIISKQEFEEFNQWKKMRLMSLSSTFTSPPASQMEVKEVQTEEPGLKSELKSELKSKVNNQVNLDQFDHLVKDSQFEDCHNLRQVRKGKRPVYEVIGSTGKVIIQTGHVDWDHQKKIHGTRTFTIKGDAADCENDHKITIIKKNPLIEYEFYPMDQCEEIESKYLFTGLRSMPSNDGDDVTYPKFKIDGGSWYCGNGIRIAIGRFRKLHGILLDISKSRIDWWIQ